MYMPAQIQLKTVKMVEIEPESDVPAARRPGRQPVLVPPAVVGLYRPRDLKSQIGHNIGFQAPIGMR